MEGESNPMRKKPYPITQLTGGLNTSLDPLFIKDSESPNVQMGRISKGLLKKNYGYASFETIKDNLVVNGTMELDANWSDVGTPTTNERSSEQANSGTYSRKFTVDAIAEGIKSDTYTTVAGTTYTVVLYIYPDDSTTATVKVRRGDDGAFAKTENVTGMTQDAWNEVTFTVTDSTGGSGAYIQVASGALNSGTWYVDDVDVQDTARVMDMGVYSKLSGTDTLIALTLRQAVRYNTTTSVFDDIDGGQVFTGDEDNIFYTAHFADEYIITNGNDAVYKYDGTTFDVLGGLAAPDTVITAKYVVSFYNHLLLLHTTEAGTACSVRVRWSDTGNAEEWDDTDATTTCGYFDLTDTSGAITGCKVLEDRLFVFKKDSIWEVYHVGGTDVFKARLIINGVGTEAGKTIQVIGENLLFMGSDNFYSFDGNILTPIGDALVNDYFLLGEHVVNAGKLNRAVSAKITSMGVYFVGLATTGDDPTILLEYDLKNNAWHKRDKSLTALGFVALSNRTTWNDFSGTWNNASGTWDSYQSSINAPFLLVGQSSGVVQKNDAAQSSLSLFTYETKDLVLAHAARLTDFRFVGKGSNVYVSYSTDSGLSWSDEDLVTLQSDHLTEKIVWLNKTCRKIRFRFRTYATSVELQYIEPWYIPRQRSDGGR